MPYDLIIRRGRIVREGAVEYADVAIDDGKIVEIAPQLSAAARETIDAAGLHVFPGVIDPHVHFNEPGRTEWEGFATGSAALAAGGGTLFFDMPLNSAPPVLDGKSFDAKVAAAQAKSVTDFALWGGITPGNLEDLTELAERGVIGFKAFMCDSGIADFPRADDYTLFEAMLAAQRFGRVVAVHAENEEITRGATVRANERSQQRSVQNGAREFCATRPIIAEVEAIQRACLLAAETRCRLHVVHVSSARGVVAVVAARAAGVDVTCETCPHYLTLNLQDFLRIGAAAKCAPPLRVEEERAALLETLRGGDVGFVASDHSPAPPSMKAGDDFFQIWGGIAGVQSTLSILLSLQPPLPLEQIARLTSTIAADRFSIAGKGAIRVGNDADLALVDLPAEYELTRDMLLDRHKLSPYVGRRFRGRVRRTILRGRTVFLEGRIVASPLGKLVKPR